MCFGYISYIPYTHTIKVILYNAKIILSMTQSSWTLNHQKTQTLLSYHLCGQSVWLFATTTTIPYGFRCYLKPRSYAYSHGKTEQ